MKHQEVSTGAPDELSPGLEAVRKLIAGALEATSLGSLLGELGTVLGGGKMLRARLALRVGAAAGVARDACLRAAAVTEMIHAASLLHDDVIDGGKLRRGAPSFWVNRGAEGAILLGDLLVCRAIALICESGEVAAVSAVVSFAGEMCDAESQQELLLRAQPADWETCVDIARRKTGALFAMAAHGCAGTDGGLRTALCQAGYAIGTAYQLADDLLDVCGYAAADGKTLGTDAAGGRLSAVSAAAGDGHDPAEYIADLCASAEAGLSRWPPVQAAWRVFVAEDVGPRISEIVERFTVCEAGAML